MAVNFTKNQDDITKAWRQVIDSKDAQNWALFGYEGNTNNIKLMSAGSNGLKELVQEFNCSLIQYAFCRIIDKEIGINKLILINWQGDSSPLSRKGLCASHVGDVADYFKGCTQTITIRNDDEATEEYLMGQIAKTSSSRISLSRQQSNATTNNDSSVGSSYKKTDISSEISSDRKSFWQRQEEEEKERLLEEKKRAAERQAQFDRERKLKEESEAKKLAETIKERDRIIEATRQAERRESSSSSSQPSSILLTNANQDNDDDDERVGRRSELIRLERNQETQSLISKGLIKNKRAIFEQASQQQQPPQQQQNQLPAGNNLTRRASGVMITQRLNTFKSLDCSNNSSNSNVEKLTNGFAKQVNVNGDEITTSTVEKEFEPVKITNVGPEGGLVSSQTTTVAADTQITTPTTTTTATTITTTSLDDVQEPKVDPIPPVDEMKEAKSPIKNGNVITKSDSPDQTANNNHKSNKSPKQEAKVDADELFMNGKYGIRAKALYDYQAADNTEISFDPDDIIGFIEKVDSGWWHGSVVTGQYKGQCGLFPANYVEELL